MLSRTAEYAVRAAVLLSRYQGKRRVSASEIAATIGAPRNYLSKVLHGLTRAGILTSTRGPGGGFALGLPPGSLSVADIADVFGEGRARGARCLLTDALCDPAHPCSAHQRWSEVTLRAWEPLMRTGIDELSGMPATRAGDPGSGP